MQSVLEDRAHVSYETEESELEGEEPDGDTVGSDDESDYSQDEEDLDGFVVPDDEPLIYDSPIRKNKKMPPDVPGAPVKRRRILVCESESEDEDE